MTKLSATVGAVKPACISKGDIRIQTFVQLNFQGDGSTYKVFYFFDVQNQLHASGSSKFKSTHCKVRPSDYRDIRTVPTGGRLRSCLTTKCIFVLLSFTFVSCKIYIRKQ